MNNIVVRLSKINKLANLQHREGVKVLYEKFNQKVWGLMNDKAYLPLYHGTRTVLNIVGRN
jgi:hypothetical protein